MQKNSSLIKLSVLVVCWVLSLFSAMVLRAQYNLPENRHWIFGNNTHLDFNSGAPVVSFVPASAGWEASTCVSDNTGQVRFCTNGSYVWDRNFLTMPGAAPIHPYGGSEVTESTAQGALIVPMVDSLNKYFLFSLTEFEHYAIDYGRMFYSVVDMSLNSGLGDIAPGRKWIAMDSNLTEKMIAIPGNRCNVWVIVHSRDSALFKAYEITRKGINLIPKISRVGLKDYKKYFEPFWSIGQMAASPDRTKIVAAYNFQASSRLVELYDFDPNTGAVSNAKILNSGTTMRAYAVCFSPDNTKVYTSASGDSVYQYNISLGNTAAIVQSRIGLAYGKMGQMQLGPDGKIYLNALMYNSFLDAINFPNLSGAACQYTPNAVNLNIGGTILGLHNLVVKALKGGDTIYVRVDTTICTIDSFKFQAPIGYDTYEWYDGGTGMQRVVKEGGRYWVISKDTCHTRIDSFIVRGIETTLTHSDVYMCLGQDTATLYAPAGYKKYMWEDSTADSIRIVATPGTYWIRGTKYCYMRTDTFTVNKVDPSFSLGADTVICDGTPLLLSIPVPDAGYSWQDGSIGKDYLAAQTGVYSAVVNKHGCIGKDTLQAVIQDVRQNLGNDTTFCSETSINILLQANVPAGDNVIWSNGSTESILLVKDTGTYSVIVSGASCIDSDKVVFKKEMCNCIFNLPTAFTPNGDGRNDIYRSVLQPGCPVHVFELKIYNRLGQLLYAGTDPFKGWDGTYKGTPCDIGTYMYTATFKGGTKGTTQMLKGDLTLIR